MMTLSSWSRVRGPDEHAALALRHECAKQFSAAGSTDDTSHDPMRWHPLTG